MSKKSFVILFGFMFLFLFFAAPVLAVDGKVNINTATVEELSNGLKKVGPKYAEAIVKYRKEHGDFKTPEEIKDVKGIGDKTFELNKDNIVLKD